VSEAVTPWLHILGVAVWLGPQLFLFVAAIPAVRSIDDTAVRARVLRTITTRFGWLAWSALLVIVLSGISNIFQEASDFDHLLDFDYRWVNYFAPKMVLVGVMVLLTAIHSFAVGPRQLALLESGDTGEEAARMRRASIIINSLVLLTSVIVVFLGVLLNQHEWSFQEV
jgi:uncharacterized membrane protein